MTVQVDRYNIELFFPRLYADPRIFEKDANLPRQYLINAGQISQEEAQSIIQRENRGPVSRDGSPSKITGLGTYTFDGKKIRSEYMRDARLVLEYLDLGSGLSPADHMGLWQKQQWWNMEFHLEKIDYTKAVLEMPDTDELYSMVKQQALPATIASIELAQVPMTDFDVAVAYLEGKLRAKAETDSLSLEIYAAKDLEPPERESLDRRLTRQSTDSTVYVILGKQSLDV